MLMALNSGTVLACLLAYICRQRCQYSIADETEECWKRRVYSLASALVATVAYIYMPQVFIWKALVVVTIGCILRCVHYERTNLI